MRHENGRFRCGDYVIRTQGKSEHGELKRLSIGSERAKAPHWEVVNTPRGDMPVELRPHLCRDLTGDGRPELLVDHKSIGANCCHEWRLYDLETGERLLQFDEGHGGGGVQPLHDGQGGWALLGSVDVFLEDWFRELSHATPTFAVAYAFTPRPPIIFRYEGGRYLPRTSDFKEHLGAQRAGLQLEEAEDLLMFTALSVLLGDWESARTSISDPSHRDFLNRVARELNTRLH